MIDQDNFELLKQITGASDERIRAVLQKHSNLDVAVSALLDDQNDVPSSNNDFIGPLPGPLTEDDQWKRGRGVLNAYGGNRNNSPVQIDVTKASPQSSTVGLAGSSFVDHPEAEKANWALVPTSQAAPVVYGPHPNPAGPYVQAQGGQDDDLSAAISASLQTSMLDASSSAAFEELSLAQRIRLNPDIPVSLRSRNPHMMHVALLTHALYHVPQVRQAFKGIVPGPLTASKEIACFWKVMARLEMGTQSDVVLDEFLPKDVRYQLDENNSSLKEAKESTETLYTQFAQVTLSLPAPFFPGLFYSKIWYPPAFGSGPSLWSSDTTSYSVETNTRADLPVIPITANVNSSDNSLLTYLHDLTWTRKLEQAGEVLVFSVTHEDGPVSSSSTKVENTGIGSSATGKSSSAGPKATTGPAQKHLLKFPAQLYVDPFLLETREITTVQRGTRSAMESGIRLSETRLSGLGGGSNTTPLKNLRASIKYFEELALDDGDEQRKQRKNLSLEMLKQTLLKIEAEIERLKEDIKSTRESMMHVYDVTGLQKHPYTLRAVLMWDGVFGRTHHYSYVKAQNGKWYKSVESTVTEVEESAVLSDPTGLHMGAGPFMLLYSKDVPETVDTIQDEPKSETQDTPEEPKMEDDQEKPPLVDTRRTYSSVAEEYVQWHPHVRNAVRGWNAQFRTQLEDAGVIDLDGKIRQESSSEQDALFIPEDPLARMHFEETEDAMDYDSDARDIEEVVMDTTASLASWGIPTDTPVSQEANISGWGPQGKDSGSWDNVTKEEGWNPIDEDPGWDAVTKEGWKPSGENKPIEVQVTRDVESTFED
ncbi:hypothetical protein M408DRAFT_325862 [Serendipita vermifera MAFF 305830]|uniref:Peptidase C19 ubiquitin carboxyl-terminal hydrolase domain-containing protein n=1 Tax=Serendipita vermifera MAFF 305830 TaxID=933852 RepID=A0A0C3BCB0_SERVB|nr:hypothetical protein M408DRAFT_325862 [Serendipita vermifera MAFF 305830]